MEKINLIEDLEHEMLHDDACAIKKSDRLHRTYLSASDKDKEIIDDIFITLCGYSLHTLINPQNK